MGWIIGVDEVGRGSLAGDVYAAGVLVEKPTTGQYPVIGVRDSKILTAEHRQKLHDQIIRSTLCGTAFAFKSSAFIDLRGIVPAVGECFRECILTLLKQAEDEDKPVDAVFVDGNPLWGPKFLTGHEESNVVFMQHGDRKEWVIGAASIIAKVRRDHKMLRLAASHPGYGWERNMGYGTEEHIAAIKGLGFTPLHRRSFCRNILDDSDSVFDMFGGTP